MLLLRRTAVIAAGTGTALVLAGCGGATASAGSEDDRLEVVASFYPLQYAAERVGGDAVAVQNLTKPGAEPHDLELTPRDVGTVSQADLVVFLHGFQPAVDDAVQTEAGAAAYDVEQDAGLDLAADGHAEEGHEGEHEGEEDHGSLDPHFWLDPLRLADVGDALAERLAGLDETNAQAYRDNAADLRTDLEALDEQMGTGLASCTSRELVTSHTAFGYLAERYDLEQEGITGLTPESEPSAQQLADVIAFVEQHEVSTIYFETLVSPAVAETVASETGATTAVLDPIEGLSEASAGEDYLEVMRTNLATLQAGQGCA